MKRNIIMIDEEKCNGCGLCITACHEGAIDLVNGKAKLAREHYCDGLGDCLPACPMNAISFEVREAPAYDEAAVKAAQQKKSEPCGCPGTTARAFAPKPVIAPMQPSTSQLASWPVQIQLVPVHAPYFHHVHLLIAADCSAYAYGNFHQEFMQGKVTIIGCPKLDPVNYAEKLAEILMGNEILSVSVVRMEVPCCGGIERATKQAVEKSGTQIPLRVVTISTTGEVL